MATQIFDTTVTTTGIVAQLGETDDAYVSMNGVISSTGSLGIYGTGARHNVNIYGSVAANGVGISLGNDATDDYLQRVFVGKNGAVASDTGAGVAITGISSFCENHGNVTGFYGIGMNGTDPNDANTSILRNFGTIHGNHEAVRRLGGEDFVFTNKGEISSDTGVAYSGLNATGREKLVNEGTITGTVQFGTGNDIYDGRGGHIVGGMISGNDGNDMLISGQDGEALQGDAGRDILTGHGGADHFIFADLGDSTAMKSGRDLISDFSRKQHDIIDLTLIDADGSSVADDSFDFIEGHAFHGRDGELRYHFAHGHTFLSADVDGDKQADFAIELKGHMELTENDILL
jgi:hypothetical protein